MLPEDGYREGIYGRADEDLAVLAVQVGSFDLLADGVGPVEHPVVVVDRQTARLRHVLLDNDLLEGTGHRRTEYLARGAETSPVGEVEIAVAGIDDDRPGSVDTGYHHQVRAVDVHRVDAVVRRVGPVHLLLGPVVRYALRIDTLADQGVYVHRRRIVRLHPRDLRPGSYLGEQEFLVLVVEVDADDVGEVADWLEGHVRRLRIETYGADLRSRGEHEILVDVIALPAVRRQLAGRAVALRLGLGRVGEAELLAAAVRYSGARIAVVRRLALLVVYRYVAKLSKIRPHLGRQTYVTR